MKHTLHEYSRLYKSLFVASNKCLSLSLQLLSEASASRNNGGPIAEPPSTPRCHTAGDCWRGLRVAPMAQRAVTPSDSCTIYLRRNDKRATLTSSWRRSLEAYKQLNFLHFIHFLFLPSALWEAHALDGPLNPSVACCRTVRVVFSGIFKLGQWHRGGLPSRLDVRLTGVRITDQQPGKSVLKAYIYIYESSMNNTCCATLFTLYISICINSCKNKHIYIRWIYKFVPHKQNSRTNKIIHKMFK